MDKVKIGKFLSQCRKAKHITQEQLAQMLDVTNKSVSKWENGCCLPDSTLYEPLCVILGITMNEFFAGERLEGQPGEADACLLKMLKYRLYCASDRSVSFQQFDQALTQVAALTAKLKAFASKEEAVGFLVEQTQAPFDECAAAYDFYVHLFTGIPGEERK